MTEPAATHPNAPDVGVEPEVFGKYYLVDKVATGGMAEIFRAKTYSHGGFQQTLVIKRILKHLGDNEDFVEMFIDEAKLSVALQHANVIRIYDFGKLLDNYFIAMEWVDGKDVRNLLRKLAKNGDYLSIEMAAFIAYEACKGLHYAHTKTDLKGQPYHIIHRDVSPSNLLVSYDGDVKVADFGIAKAKSNAGTTDVGIIKGKFDYMSPEQAEGRAVDHRSDVFALGVVFWEMLAGRRLFKGATDIETLGRVRAAMVDAPSIVNPRVPPAFDRVVMKALARRPEDRYSSAEAMAEDLLVLMKPDNPDQVRQRLGKSMQALFAVEIAAERARLDTTTDVAARLHSAVPAPFQPYGTNPTVSRTNAPTGGGAAGFVAFGLGASMLAGAVFLVAVAVIAAVVLWPAPPPPPVASTPEAPTTTGSLDVLLLPGGKILVDGEEKGLDEATLSLAPGPHHIRVEQDGYEPIEEDVTIALGQTARFKRTLVPVAKAVPTRVVTRVVTAPAAAVAPAVVAPAAPVDGGPGKVVVSVQGGGWADVWVDGEKQAKTAPLTVSLPPGKHTVRLQNAELGVDKTEDVEVTAGGTARVVGHPK